MSLGMGSEVSDAQVTPSVPIFLLPKDPDAKLSSFSSTIPACMRCASHHDDTRLNL